MERIEGLMRHPAFTLTNPNRVRSVLGAFGAMNLLGFHRKDGAGYRLLAGKAVEVDRRNPQVAARLLTAFSRWRRFDTGSAGADARRAGARRGGARPVARQLRDREQVAGGVSARSGADLSACAGPAPATSRP